MHVIFTAPVNNVLLFSAIDCGPPNVPANAFRINQGNLYGDMASYGCLAGYEICPSSPDNAPKGLAKSVDVKIPTFKIQRKTWENRKKKQKSGKI